MFTHYLSTALRHFARHKLTTAIKVACLAAGLLCLMFSLGAVRYLSASDAFYANASRMYVVTTELTLPGQGRLPVTTSSSFSVAKYLRAAVPSSVVVTRASTLNEQTSLAVEGQTHAIRASYADPDFTRIFDFDFIAGERANALASPRSVVLTEDLARQLYRSTDVVGRSLLVNGRDTVTVTGVMAAPRQPSHMSTTSNRNGALNFQALISMDVHEATIAQETPEVAAIRLNRPTGFAWYHTYVLLPEDGSVSRAAVDRSLARIAEEHGSDVKLIFATSPMTQIQFVQLNRIFDKADTGLSMTTLLYALGILVVFIAALNYANLAAAQAVVRMKEAAMRRVVGATRGDLVSQYLFEAFLLTALSLALMLAVAATLRLVLAGPLADALDILLFGATSPQFWIAASCVLAAVTVLAGLYPALATARVRPALAVKTSRAGRGSSWVASLLVGVQFFAASFMLIAVFVMSAENRLIAQTIEKLTDDPVLTLANDVRKSGVDLERLRTELRGSPAVVAVSGSMFPMGIAPNDSARVYESPDESARRVGATVQVVDHDFLDTLAVDMVAGRAFSREFGDDVSDAARPTAGNIIVDEAMVERMGWASAQAAIGKTLYVPGLANGIGRRPTASTVVGVAQNKAMFVLGFGDGGVIYQLAPKLTAYPLVRISRVRLSEGRAALEAAWSRLAPGIALEVLLLDEKFDRGLEVFKLIAAVLSGMAMFAICIAVVGLIGMATHMASRRTHEIGVRKTLGASVVRILRMLLADFARPVVIANLLAWPLAFVASRIYLSLFVERTALTPLPFVASLTVTLVVVWLAVAAPAIRAARVRPVGVLRYE